MVKNLSILSVFGLMSFTLFGQNLISYISVNTDNVYIGQPVQLTVSVYTSTWFTSGIDVGNIQVDGALTVYFRSVSNTKIFGDKKYAGVDFYYNVFPTKEGQINIPSLSINVESPRPGDYKGIKRIIKTKSKSLIVKGVPLGYNPNNWLVATRLNITEKWTTSLSNIKVGDVIQRTITRSVGGTLSEFIPATKWDNISGISIYPKRAKLITNKSKTGVSSSRSETVNYLFEKEGEIVLPSIQYVYWNSWNKKFYKKQIDSVVILVKPNADLAMLGSIKKSLQKESIKEIIQVDEPLLIFGLTPKTFTKYLIAGVLIVFLFFKIFKKTNLIIKNNYYSYLKSEPFAFNQVKKAIRKKDYYAFVKTSNTWLVKLDSNHPTLQEFVRKNGSENLIDNLKQINESIFKYQKPSDNNNYKLLLIEMKNTRNNFLAFQKKKKKSTSKNNKWLNPTAVV